MKTLDKGIRANECCDHGEPDSRCEDCPYNSIGSCCLERENDTLHYLKVLKDILDPLKVKKVSHTITCPQCNSMIAILLPESNEPLTWEELRTMKDKPVWWTHGEVGEWLTIYNIPKNDNGVIYATTCSGIECWIYKKDMNKYQYYQKE